MSTNKEPSFIGTPTGISMLWDTHLNSFGVDAGIEIYMVLCDVVGLEHLARAGELLAEGWGGAYGGSKSDRVSKVLINGFSRHFKCTHICEKCLAVMPYRNCDSKFLNYADFNQNAPHHMTEISHEHYLETEPKVSPMSIIPGWHLQTLWEDGMHTLQLGTFKDAVGSCFG